jgi:hypothetical protein
MNKRYLLLIWCIVLNMHMVHTGTGCLADYGPLGTLDYKEWRLVRNCTCDCERSHTIMRGGLCSGCKHRHPTVPINAPRNIINMQAVVRNVNINRLKQHHQTTSSTRE